LVGLVALCVALLQRWRATHGRLGIEGLVLQGATFLGLVGLVATVLAALGHFGAISLGSALGALALAVWPWSSKTPAVGPRPRARTLAVALLAIVGAMALRLPPIPHALAGRDQGTYLLRAEHTVRTGALGFVDPVLAAAGRQQHERPGPADILGLHERRRSSGREDNYEAAYRPGFYLTSRDGGVVVPQFLHLHPMLLACSRLALGRGHAVDVVVLEGMLMLLAFWAVARRLWQSAGWATLAAGLLAISPLAIWVHRNALSETIAGLLPWAALLAVLRARDGGLGDLRRAAFLLGCAAWVRGNAWATAPAVLAVLWLIPHRGSHPRPVHLYLGMIVASVGVHAHTVFPYLFDELGRQLHVGAPPSPWMLLGLAALGAAIWLAVDRFLFGGLAARKRTPRLDRLLAVAPRALVVGSAIAVAAYLVLRVMSEPRPHSRLDPALPLLGVPLLLAALVGLVVGARRWLPKRNNADIWLLALATIPLSSLSLFAQRNLPQVGLYYYGRYLVPELLPLCCLLAAGAVRVVHGMLAARARAAPSRFRDHLQFGVTTALCTVLAWGTGGVLITHPVTRLREFVGAERGISWLAERIPTDAVVIAGGEGWHHGHTFNQVGGALAIGHGRSVLRYRTSEAAYASLHELLVTRPRASGEAAPPVFLLVNEATHAYTRPSPDRDGPKVVVAAVDDLLPPPFVARDIDLLDLYVHRLTPVTDAIPTRVTRDGLRMALMRIEVDPAREKEAHTVSFADGELRGSTGMKLRGGTWRGGALCLSDKKSLELRLQQSADGSSPLSLVVVAAPGTAPRNHGWTIEVDERAVAINMPRAHPRERDTLGPFVLTRRPSKIRIRGSKQRTEGATCPHGGLAEVRLLGPDAPAVRSAAAVEAVTTGPEEELGQPYAPVHWVSGRGLSRYRTGTRPEPEIGRLALVLRKNRPLGFAPAHLPDAGQHPVDLVVTLTRARVRSETRIRLLADDEVLADIDPPDSRDGSWQSKPVRFVPTGPTVRVRLELVHARGSDAYVHVRDVGLFSTGDAVPSRLE
jgi:hypothetical protein